MDSSVLIHHGIKGQKWGVRRYQNKDGTLTSAGKKRYGDDTKNDKKSSNPVSSRKQRGQMTDAELAQRIQRLEKEVKLKDLEKRNYDAGRDYANDILKSIGRKVITTAASGAILYGGKVLIDGNFDVSGLASAVFNGGPKKK